MKRSVFIKLQQAIEETRCIPTKQLEKWQLAAKNELNENSPVSCQGHLSNSDGLKTNSIIWELRKVEVKQY
jgi:hypothetical protein